MPAISKPAQHAGPSRTFHAAQARMCYQHTEGNPLFMVHRVASWPTQGILQEQNEACILPAEVEVQQARVPDSLRQMIDVQLDQLSVEAQPM